MQAFVGSKFQLDEQEINDYLVIELERRWLLDYPIQEEG